LRISRLADLATVWLENLVEPDPLDDGLPVVPPHRARAVVVSFYMPNIARRVIAAQRQALKRFVPDDVAIEQIRTLRNHGDALTRFMRETRYRTVLFLDIDCIPIRPGAIEGLLTMAEQGHLAGAAFRANHRDNGQHIYAGPFCLAVTREVYQRLGNTDFAPSRRGDVAEELTFAAEKVGVPIDLLWPVSSDDSIWALTGGKRYGHGTTYDGGFWHAFQIRLRKHQTEFVERCAAFLQDAASAAPAGDVKGTGPPVDARGIDHPA